jgi:catechol 2,3-dioxygenase-like lactoylglutathione lyase family enzyme
MPQIAHLLETALYVEDMDRATAFYRDVLRLRVIDASARLVAMDAGASTLLLLFCRGATVDGAVTPGGWIPPHNGEGPAHVAFAVAAADLPSWEGRLADHGIAIESRVRWNRDGQSIYFRDPDGHSVELVTPGTWDTY